MMGLDEDSLSHQSQPPDHTLPAMINPDWSGGALFSYLGKKGRGWLTTFLGLSLSGMGPRKPKYRGPQFRVKVSSA